MDARDQSSSSQSAELTADLAAQVPSTSGAATCQTSPMTTATPVPVRPSVPKPSNLPTGLRHKFANISVGSLPTIITTGEIEAISADAVESSDSESGLDADSDDEPSSPSWSSSTHHGGITESDILRVYGETLRVQSFSSSLGVEEDMAESVMATDKLSCSSCSDLDVDELDYFLDDSLLPPRSLLNLAEGIQPPNVLPTCPPISWLMAAGFDVPSSQGFTAVPRAPICGEKPTQYLNLFCRQMIARQRTSDLTVGSLARHDAILGRRRHVDGARKPHLPAIGMQDRSPTHLDAPAAVPPSAPEVLAQNGAWLEAFIARARAVPLHKVTDQLLGGDVGKDVAVFLDGLSDGSDCGASITTEDQPDGLLVTAPKICSRPVHQGRGRTGFHVDNEVPIATPGRSQSPALRRSPPPLPMQAPQPPMVRAPVTSTTSAIAALRRTPSS